MITSSKLSSTQPPREYNKRRRSCIRNIEFDDMSSSAFGISLGLVCLLVGVQVRNGEDIQCVCRCSDFSAGEIKTKNRLNEYRLSRVQVSHPITRNPRRRRSLLCLIHTTQSTTSTHVFSPVREEEWIYLKLRCLNDERLSPCLCCCCQTTNEPRRFL